MLSDWAYNSLRMWGKIFVCALFLDFCRIYLVAGSLACTLGVQGRRNAAAGLVSIHTGGSKNIISKQVCYKRLRA